MSWTRVVWAARTPTLVHKLVYESIRLLDRGDGRGCFATARALGARLALSERTVETARQQLRQYGLLASEGATRGVSWFVRLPAGCEPTGRRVPDTSILALSRRLDTLLQQPAAAEPPSFVEQAKAEVQRLGATIGRRPR